MIYATFSQPIQNKKVTKMSLQQTELGTKPAAKKVLKRQTRNSRKYQGTPAMRKKGKSIWLHFYFGDWHN